jgi:hypothetical protein
MQLKEAIAKVVPAVRKNIIANLNGTNNRQLQRTRRLNTPYLKRNPNYWKYPYPRSRTLLNSIKVVQLRNVIVVKVVEYGLYLETGTKRNGKPAITPKRPWFKDAFNKAIKKDLAKELSKAYIAEIKAGLLPQSKSR